jgi:hypothetical protein
MNSKTPIGVILPGIFIWSLPLSLLVSIQYITNPEFKTITISVIFPLILSLMSRYARFWVARSAVALAGIFTILLILLLLRSQKNKDALSKPLENKQRSGIIYGSIIFTFLMSMVFTGVFIEPLYNPSNFS